MSLSPLGERLKRATPLTAREDSLALLTLAGALVLTGYRHGLGRAVQPLLGLKMNWMSLYPFTMPMAIFHIKMIKYLSLLLS